MRSAETIRAVIDNATYGLVAIETVNDAGRIIDRHPVHPGSWDNGTWMPTDIAALPEEARESCAALWTPEVVTAYQKQFPWVDPIPELQRLLRAQRNVELAATDWTQLADSPVDKARWAIYRQQLRDLPANTPDPRKPAWPKRPDDPDTQAAERELDRAARTILFDGKNKP